MSEVISIISNILISICAIVTVLIAYKGLNAWKDQMRAKSQYEVAIGLLRSTYKLRDRINAFRQPFMPAGESAHALEDREIAEQNGFESIRESQKGVVAGYLYRRKEIIESLENFDVASLEAEVLWGNDVKTLTKDVYGLIREINWAIGKLISLSKEKHIRNRSDKVENRVDSILYGDDDKEDEYNFGAILEKTVNNIENFLKPKIEISQMK